MSYFSEKKNALSHVPMCLKYKNHYAEQRQKTQKEYKQYNFIHKIFKNRKNYSGVTKIRAIVTSTGAWELAID